MKTEITISLHENYVNIVIRLYGTPARSYVEHSFCGSNAVSLIKDSINVDQLKERIAVYEQEEIDVKRPYLVGYRGVLVLKYKALDTNIKEFTIIETRCINKSRGGRSVSGAFLDVNMKSKIFNNLLNAIAVKDVERLNVVTGALYQIGG